MQKILLSIKPVYVDLIIKGIKKVEYRKKIASRTDIIQILIYASHPISCIIGEFQVKGILSGTPEEIWDMTSDIGGINKDEYFSYFSGHSKAYAYQIGNVKIYSKPYRLSEYNIRRAPQNFMYIEDFSKL